MSLRAYVNTWARYEHTTRLRLFSCINNAHPSRRHPLLLLIYRAASQLDWGRFGVVAGGAAAGSGGRERWQGAATTQRVCRPQVGRMRAGSRSDVRSIEAADALAHTLDSCSTHLCAPNTGWTSTTLFTELKGGNRGPCTCLHTPAVLPEVRRVLELHGQVSPCIFSVRLSIYGQLFTRIGECCMCQVCVQARPQPR